MRHRRLRVSDADPDGCVNCCLCRIILRLLCRPAEKEKKMTKMLFRMCSFSDNLTIKCGEYVFTVEKRQLHRRMKVNEYLLSSRCRRMLGRFEIDSVFLSKQERNRNEKIDNRTLCELCGQRYGKSLVNYGHSWILKLDQFCVTWPRAVALQWFRIVISPTQPLLFVKRAQQRLQQRFVALVRQLLEHC